MPVITELANFSSSYAANALPTGTRRTISLLTLDLIGAAAAGLRSQLADAARNSALESYGEGHINIWLTDKRSGVVGAAMANSAAASALDIDDGHRAAGATPVQVLFRQPWQWLRLLTPQFPKRWQRSRLDTKSPSRSRALVLLRQSIRSRADAGSAMEVPPQPAVSWA